MPNGASDVTAGAPNPQSYTDNGNGTVTDKVTGLMWQQAPGGVMALADATTYCSGLALGGQGGWRLPSRIELISINDVSRTDPCLNVTAFPGMQVPGGMQSAGFWSSSPRPSVPGSGWVEDFGLGGSSTSSGTSSAFVRCVRTAAGGVGHHYTAGAGTVYDAATRLTWQEPAPSATYAWSDALAYCSGLGASLGGPGWRLPTVNELQTLLDVSRETPAIDTTAFPSTPTTFSVFTWTASRVAGTRVTDSWAVNFGVGNGDLDVMTAAHNVRCVR